ncbi:MAG: hypothetical protein KGS61_12400, partial [Verrucomicrobia bacterium]|nr:hypothetical protein [Verrucomicrobiota bacterium]
KIQRLWRQTGSSAIRGQIAVGDHGPQQPWLKGAKFSYVTGLPMRQSNASLQFTVGLEAANWSSGQSATGTGGPITLADTNATAKTRFYRVIAQ